MSESVTFMERCLSVVNVDLRSLDSVVSVGVCVLLQVCMGGLSVVDVTNMLMDMWRLQEHF